MKDSLKKALWGEFSTKRLVRSMIIIPILSYLAFAAYAYFFSEQLIFQPQQSSYTDDKEIIKLISKDGTEISAIHLQNPNAEYVILYSHGNAEDIGDGMSDIQTMQRIGFSVFAFDYHGYGTSRGKPTERNAYEDEDAAYDYLTLKLGVPADRIIALGRSLGGAAAVDLASRRPLAGLIVESSFISAFRVFSRFPLLPFDKFRNIDKIKNVKCPVLIIHGRADEIIPFYHGVKLFEAANQPKKFLWAEGADHNNLRMIAGKDYWNALREFALFIKGNK